MSKVTITLVYKNKVQNVGMVVNVNPQFDASEKKKQS